MLKWALHLSWIYQEATGSRTAKDLDIVLVVGVFSRAGAEQICVLVRVIVRNMSGRHFGRRDVIEVPHYL